ncbi:MAG: response regulator [Magnetococcales bacterium]|nr:response regulator [Magnetococcales bacterium]
MPEHRPRILIVDDVPGSIRALAELLGDGYAISMAANGPDALKVAASHQPDLILLDVVMPIMDGYEVCRQLQANAATQAIPIIFVTARDDPWDESRGLQLGAVDFITKPVRSQIVQARVKTHLELKKQRDILKENACQLEQRVIERTRELQAIFDTAVDAIITIDEQGLIQSVNAAGETMFGYAVGDLAGQNVKVLMSTHDRDSHDGYIRRFLTTQRKIALGASREVIGCKKDGTLFPLDISIAEVQLTDRRLFTAIIRDATQRKQLAESALRHARLASLGTLAAGVAHEINNPNNAIGFAAATLERLWQAFTPMMAAAHDGHDDHVCGLTLTEGVETMATLIREIGLNTRRIATIVANLKQGIRGEDREQLNQSVNINQALQSAVAMLQSSIRRHTDCLSLTLSDDLMPVKGNHHQLEQVFINLIQNGLQSLPDRQHGLSVTTTMIHQPQVSEVVVHIQDQGCGIEPDQINLITQPFHTTKSKSGGTGLGLSITKTIVDHHRGSMTFQSQPNQGTLVTVRFPSHDP